MTVQNELDELVERVPGTSFVVDKSHITGSTEQKAGDIILHPQPSKDPNDPLNWTKFRKELHYALLWLWALILATSVNWVAPVYEIMADTYNATLNQMNISSALCYLFLGVGCVVLQPLALKYGRRPVYIFATVLHLVGNAILGGITSLGVLYTSNILTGISAAPVDSLVQISITDIFFLHEHGTRLSVYLFAMYSGSYLGPLAAGYIYDGQKDWKWCPWWLVIIGGILIIVQIFAMDETLYKRKLDGVPQHMNDALMVNAAAEKGSLKSSHESIARVASNASETPPPPLKTYWQRMKLFHLEHGSDFSLLHLFWSPFPTLRYPAVAWCSFVYGIQICWLSLLTVSESIYFSGSPYNFSPDAIGLVNLASWIGGFFGMLYGSWSDWFQIWMTRRNKGVFEPEFRLWTLSISGLLNVAGLLMYGLGVAHGIHWMFPVMGVALISFGISACGAIAITYAVDCYPEETGYTMVIILLIRNLLGTLFTFVFEYWLDAMGVVNNTICLACICFAANFSFLIFVKWGKTWRRWTANWYYKSIERQV